jgi:hypothetical protein
MAKRKPGSSPHTRRRHALAHVASLEAERAKRARSRPRTSGKKGAKTRALNKLTRRIAAAKGQLTKALNAIARATSERSAAKDASKRKRSEAAKKGWSKRKAAATPAPPSEQSARPLQFLEERDGEVAPILIYPPDKADRSAIGSYWYAFRNLSEQRLDDITHSI